jgi:hypothetical protein
MKRLALILAASFLVAVSTAKAGELDAEYGPKATKGSTPTLATGAASSELDSESPDQACCWRKRFYGYGCFARPYYCGFGYGGFGYGGFGGYGGYGGFGGGYAGLGYGGFGGGYGGFGGMYW